MLLAPTYIYMQDGSGVVHAAMCDVTGIQFEEVPYDSIEQHHMPAQPELVMMTSVDEDSHQQRV